MMNTMSSPIRNPQSQPKSSSGSKRKSHPDDFMITPIIRDVVIDFHSNIQKWNVNHDAGVDLVLKITQTKKSDCYSEKLQNLCLQLEVICDKADEIVEKMYKLSDRVSRLQLITENRDCNIFFTWPIKKFGDCLQNIFTAYQKEAKVKRIVLENVAHSSNNSLKMLYLTAWVYQTQITDQTSIELESILLETKLK